MFNITITEGDYTHTSHSPYMNKVDPTQNDYADVPSYEVTVPSHTNYHDKFQFIGSRSDGNAFYYATEILLYGYEQTVW